MSLVFYDRVRRRIRLTSERIKHIGYHMHLSDKLHLLEATLKKPDLESVEDEVVYYQKYLKEEGLYFVVAVKVFNGGGFVVTVFKSRKPK